MLLSVLIKGLLVVFSSVLIHRVYYLLMMNYPLINLFFGLYIACLLNLGIGSKQQRLLASQRFYLSCIFIVAYIHFETM